MTLENTRVTLASRPNGEPTKDNFKIEKVPVPEIGPDQILLKVIYLSLDPYMRGRMSDAKSYAPPVQIGEVMCGGTVARVEKSNNPNFSVGDLVLSMSGWQQYEVSNGKMVEKLPASVASHPSLALGVLGMPGFTAYMGLLDIGNPKPGETVVVAAAAGPVGACVGQIAKIKGCRVVGIAGGKEKCDYVTKELGFDECIDHYQPNLAELLAKACPKGIDVYFENVGGKVFDAVFPLLNSAARVPLCGMVSMYNAEKGKLPEGPDRSAMVLSTILVKRIRVQGFIIFLDYGHRFGEFAKQMGEWVSQGKIKFREHITNGLENAPSSFFGMLKGHNFGKAVVEVSKISNL